MCVVTEFLRGTESEEAIQKRLRNAHGEMDAAEEAGLFDHIVVNANLNEAVERFKEIIVKEIVNAP